MDNYFFREYFILILNAPVRIGVRGGGRGGGRPPGIEKFQGKLCFQGKRKLIKNPEW